MPFDTALSGIRAASTDLSVTGNNIANASTAGFKNSRAEFADVYATSVLGAGQGQAGAGVKVSNIRQDFTQGNVSFTERALDLAINGSGFFVLNNEGDVNYTRAGTFGLNEEGYIVANNGSRLKVMLPMKRVILVALKVTYKFKLVTLTHAEQPLLIHY